MEALLSSPGIGYFLWNEYNNLNLNSVILSIILIGLLGVLLDGVLGFLAKRVTYAE